MSSPGKGRRIVWQVRALAVTGLLVVALTLGLVAYTLSQVRSERTRVATEQEELRQTSERIRQLALKSRTELLARFDETTPLGSLAAMSEFDAVATALATSTPDPGLVAALKLLQVDIAGLQGISVRTTGWRSAYDIASGDINENRTLNRARGLVTTLRNAIEAMEGRRRLDEALKFRRWRNAAGEDAARMARDLLLERAGLQSHGSIDFSSQLTEFARLIEVLGGAEQLDSLADLKDNQVKPLLDRMTRSIASLGVDEALVLELSPRTIEAFKVVLFGEGFVSGEGHQNVQLGTGGLFALRRDVLQLRHERERLKVELAGRFQDCDARITSFDQSVQNRSMALAGQVEQTLRDGWRHMLLFGSSACVLFVWLAWRIARGIRAQVDEIERARSDAENSRHVAERLMREQQQSAKALSEAHKELVDASRKAGMAEIATSVLHNVGNVLNSVNVSVGYATTRVKESPVQNLDMAVQLIAAHKADLGMFLTEDVRGKQLPDYLATVTETMRDEQKLLLDEMASLARNIDHIKQIVSVQQQYAKRQNVVEAVDLAALIEDAIHITGLDNDGIQIERQYSQLPETSTDKHALLQILINVLGNAKHAVLSSGRQNRRVSVNASVIEHDDGDIVRIQITDNGVGIAPENLTRIFKYGFTTKTEGHGFGLHASANSAKQLGGSLSARSDGLGAGAVFVIDLLVSMEVVPA